MWVRGSLSAARRYRACCASFGLAGQTIWLTFHQHWGAALAHPLHAFAGNSVDGHNIVGVDGNDRKTVAPRVPGWVVFFFTCLETGSIRSDDCPQRQK